MILDIFSELRAARPARDVDARLLFELAIEQARLADALGFGCWWAVEHHTDPVFSFSSAPDLVRTAIARHTRRIRRGTSGILSPFEINHPVRIAERGALVDVLSNGRLELGLARSGGAEWETFGVDPDRTRDQLREAQHVIPRIWTGHAFKWEGELLRVPERDFVPKPLQKPHPPLWQTVSNPQSCEIAGELGVGMLGSCVFVPVDRIRPQLDDYERGLARCRPAGEFVNDQRAMFTIVHCTRTKREAIESRAGEAALWFMNVAPRVFRTPRDGWVNLIRGAIGHGAAAYPMLDSPEAPPSAEDLNDPVPAIALLNRQRAGQVLDPEEVYEVLDPIDTVVIGDVETCRRKLRRIAGQGLDRLMCLMQFGPLPHAAAMGSIRLVGEELVPELHAEPQRRRAVG
jgi:alkanesulfonate monooxygenase SsuD/methylene tetrahydromethanopterin reductase-like flavin-dependent oxidoreductase (luciferase family)